MKSKIVEDADVVTYVVVCDPGDEAGQSLGICGELRAQQLHRHRPRQDYIRGLPHLAEATGGCLLIEPVPVSEQGDGVGS
jgi:hypothetical protein